MSTQDDDLSWPDDAVEVARIGDAWGVKGWIRVEPYARDPKALLASRRWFLQPPAGRPRPAAAPVLPRLLQISQAREHGDGVVAAAREIADRSAAEALKGARIFVSRATFPAAAEGEYYWVDLIGLDVVNRRGESLGQVADLLDTGAHSVLRVLVPPSDATVAETAAQAAEAPQPGKRARAKPAAPEERLIPFVAAYIDEVRLPERRILVDWEADY